MIRGLLGFLLMLTPEAFRARFGEELLAVHEERARGLDGGFGTMRFAVSELAGMTRTVLRLRLMGSAEYTQYDVREDGTMMGTFMHNARLGLRSLRKNPGYSVTAVLVLALGIGATAGIFSVANAFFFSPLPFDDENELVLIYETNPDYGWTHAQAAPANVLDWREQVAAFEDVAMYNDFVNDVTYVGEGDPVVLSVSAVTGNFFDVLGVRPHLGRGFRSEETWAGAEGGVILSHGTWETIFGADEGLIGRTIELNGTSIEVVGVMPEVFRFPGDDVQLWSTMGWDRSAREQVWFRRAHWVRPIARLADGVTPSEADAQLQVVVRRLSEEYPETNRVMGAGLMPVRDFLVMDMVGPIRLLMGAVVLLLVLACVNVANLALVRMRERRRELGLMAALGAGRARVAGMLAQEGVVVAVLGGFLGLGLAWAGISAVEGLATLGIDGATSIGIDGRVLTFTLGVSVLSGLVSATVPVLSALGIDLRSELHEGGRTQTTGRGRARSVRLLVAAEVGLAVLLTVGAGLMLRSFVSLRAQDPGFRIEGVLGVTFSIPDARYPERDQVLALQERFVAELEGRPGIQRVGVTRALPMEDIGWSGQTRARGWPDERVIEEMRHRAAGPGYFEALDIPLISGRMFGPDDGPDSPLVVLINEAAAQQYFAGEDPVGQFITNNRVVTEDSRWFEIIGVVGDQHQLNPGTPPWPEIYENPRQDWTRSPWMAIRVEGDPLNAVPAVRSVLSELDPEIAVAEMRTQRDVWRASMAEEELVLVLLGTFGLTALLLSVVGVYGVTAQAARSRTQEIGVRMALGAVREDVVGLMLRQGMVPVAIGLAVGIGASLMASRALGAFLHGVEPNDPTTMGVVVLVLGGAAAIASLVPAARAARVDPVESLRSE